MTLSMHLFTLHLALYFKKTNKQTNKKKTYFSNIICRFLKEKKVQGGVESIKLYEIYHLILSATPPSPYLYFWAGVTKVGKAKHITRSKTTFH